MRPGIFAGMTLAALLVAGVAGCINSSPTIPEDPNEPTGPQDPDGTALLDRPDPAAPPVAVHFLA